MNYNFNAEYTMDYMMLSGGLIGYISIAILGIILYIFNPIYRYYFTRKKTNNVFIKNLRNISRFILIMTSALFIVSFLVVTLSSYCNEIFPFLPSEIGGGHAKPVSVVTEDNILINEFENKDILLLDFNNNMYILKVVNGEESYVIQVPVEKIYVKSKTLKN